ncbi:MAG: sulfur oxidation c-type cytochrome SoxX [Curvibacter sp. GWA2_64_110]|nr:MAG: sulfur oxidation c-type cytochrome SoxX [Curvibacter sp. GWA2_64_110]HCY14704.1 sulfur oxidation c-type cytochrome SoxX [Curvibacter sp.]
MKKTTFILVAVSAAVLAGCATVGREDYKKAAQEMFFRSFETKGIATVDRLNQDEIQAACSEAEMNGKDLDEKLRARLEAAQMATIKPPSDGKFLGDWTKAEKIAQSGVGMAWNNKPGTVNGGNCFACHQLTKKEISFGTLGPSLYNFGKIRGVTDPNSPAAKAMVEYTWGKLYNAKAFNACTNMPRFGHLNGLTETQLKDLVAYLLDPKSPVNQ